MIDRPIAIPAIQRSGRRTADERRQDVLRAALVEFATFGLHGASTVNIARRAGISQPYVLRLFQTKKRLFIETTHMARRRIEWQWSEALRELPETATPGERLEHLGMAFRGITGQADVLRLQLHAFSASADDEVREQCQQGMGGLFAWVREATGAPAEAVQTFFATGMMIMVGVSIGAPDVMAEPEAEWARAFMLQPLNGEETR